MEKLRASYNYISNINFAYVLVLGLLSKALILDVSYATFLITVPVLAFEGYRLYIKSKTPEPIQHDLAIIKRFDQFQEDLDKVKSKVNANNLEKNISSGPAKRYF